jgi:thiol-disulfide isomerase/thioredoxin
MINKLLKTLFTILLFFLTIALFGEKSFVQAQESVYLTIFYSDVCPHCADEKIFLEKLENKYDFLTVRQYKVSKYSELFGQVSHRLGKTAAAIPFTVIGDEAIIGYLNDKTTGAQIEEMIIRHSHVGCNDVVGAVLKEHGLAEEVISGEVCDPGEDSKEGLNITLPVFGQINSASVSLPILTIMIGFLDGFNPCAMWVLLFLLSLLINMRDKRKLWLLGSTFIFVSGIVYFLFLTAWLNVFLFLGFIPMVRIIIGLVAIVSGIMHLRDYQQNRTGCKATNKEKRQKTFQKIQTIVHTKSFWLALFGIITLAVSVNMLELVCSAGLPAIYTQVLTLANLPIWQYYAFLLLYVLIFIIDDLVIFIIAVKTWHTIGVSGKFSRFSSLIGGIIILLLGILLIFQPNWVMFG